MTNLEFAKLYLSLGWSIIPIKSVSKVPGIDEWKSYQTRCATSREIEMWFRDPAVNIGLVCGQISKLVVVDSDLYKNSSGSVKIFSPLQVFTPRGGRHDYFKYTAGLKNSINSEIATDFKTDGGYVLLPSSVGANLKRYVWNELPTKDLLARLPELPKEIIEKLVIHPAHSTFDYSATIGVDEGERNNALYSNLVSTLNHIRDEERETKGWLHARGVNNSFSKPLSGQEVETTFKSALAFVRSNPPKQISANNIASSAHQQTNGKPLSLKDVGRRRNEERELEKNSPSTGYPEFDQLVGGFLPKHFWTLTGETNVGKTAFACNLAENVRKQGRRVLYVALEPDYKIVDYLASIRTGKSFQNLTDIDLTFDDGLTDIFTLVEIPTYQDLIRAVKESPVRYDLVIIDHIGYFCRSSSGEQYLQEQATTIRDLVQLTKRVAICIVAIAHPRKPSLSINKPRVISLYDVSGSAAFAQDSTEVIVVYRPPETENDPTNQKLSSVGAVLVQKTKHGENGSFRVVFQNGTALITGSKSEHKQPFLQDLVQMSELGAGDVGILKFLAKEEGFQPLEKIADSQNLDAETARGVLDSLVSQNLILFDEKHGYAANAPTRKKYEN